MVKLLDETYPKNEKLQKDHFILQYNQRINTMNMSVKFESLCYQVIGGTKTFSTSILYLFAVNIGCMIEKTNSYLKDTKYFKYLQTLSVTVQALWRPAELITFTYHPNPFGVDE